MPIIRRRTLRNLDSRPTLAAPDDDPYLWLEDIEGARALRWVRAQNRATLARFADARCAADRDALRRIFDRPDNLPIVARRGGLLFNFWRDKAHRRGLWRRTTLDRYRTARPRWETLLDLDRLAREEREDWIWGGAATLPPGHGRAILSLSRGGADAAVLREFDLAARRFAEDGFALPEAKGGAEWLDPETLLLSSTFGAGMATRSGYPRAVRVWRRGADPAAAPVIFATGEDRMAASAAPDRAAGPDRVRFVEQLGFFDKQVWIGGRGGPETRIDLPTDAEFDWQRGWLAVKPRQEWHVGGTTHPPDSVLLMRWDAFLAGERAFARVFEPAGRRILRGFFWCAGLLVLSILDDLRPVFEILTQEDGDWRRERLAGLPEIGSADLWPLDLEEEESNGELLALAQDPLTPPSLFLAAPRRAPELLRRGPVAFAAEGLVVSRHEALSADGTRIPYVQVGPAGASGDAPVHMTGYGGFEVSLLPSYNSAVGKLWLERGGTSVVANLRGGGEFGTPWHEAGRREGKKRSHDDFAAVAADLDARGVTRPGRIAAEGGSNGGLLIANMLVRYPERFGALLCTIPLIDMRRYSKLLAGASWIAEYGDPEDPRDWAFLREISAYQLAAPGRPYPPILLATTRRDDRVHPGHARKMTAKLQAMGYDACFYEPEAGGHGYGRDNRERAFFTALGYRFLAKAIGWEPAPIIAREG